MTTTVRETNALHIPDALQAMETALVVVHHPNANFLGLRRVVLSKNAVDLGRESGAFGEGSLEHPLISRFHARVAVDQRGQCTINDLGSANGTWVDGIRVVSAPVSPGAIIRLGPVLLSVQTAPASYPTRRSERAPIISYNTAQCVDRLRAILREGGLLRIAQSNLDAVLPYIELLAEELGHTHHGVVSWDRAYAIARESESSDKSQAIIVINDHKASCEQIESTLSALQKKRIAAVAVHSQHEHEPSSGESSERSKSLGFPSVSARIEDVPWFLRAELHKHFASPVQIDHTLAYRLLRASWPENMQGLRQWVAMAVRRWPSGTLSICDEDLKFTGEPLRLSPRDEENHSSTSANGGSSTADSPAMHLLIARHGGWFSINHETVVDIRTRFALARILRTLVQQQAKSPDETVAIDTLVEAGWPGEKLLGDSGNNRLYVAVATLRKLGLRDGVERREGGYRLAPHWIIQISDSETPVAHSSKDIAG